MEKTPWPDTISVFFYELSGIRTRQGFLLRCQWPEGVGYGDCHVWPELGDIDLEGQMTRLKERRPTPILSQSLAAARAQTLENWQDWIDKASTLENHHLDDGTSIPEDFCDAKHKVDCLDKSQMRINECPHVRWKIDFNNKFSYHEVRDFLCGLCKQPLYIEDPVGAENWSQLIAFPLAADRIKSENVLSLAKFLIIKPNSESLLSSTGCLDKYRHLKFSVTSYLGHPLGQVYAAVVAAQLQNRYSSRAVSHGLISHRVYKSNVFSDCLSVRKNYLFVDWQGFVKRLEQVKWKKL